MSKAIAQRRTERFRSTAVSFTLILIFACLAVIPTPARAWKPKTHIYIANVIMADALDNGKVWIPPFGEFDIDPVALQVMRNDPDFFRAGAVGPDGFPDMFTGQMKIHTSTDPWIQHLWDCAQKYAAGEVNQSPLLDPDSTTRNALGPRDANQAWAFVYGYLTHCGGDMWAHDWVNYYAEGVFPGLSEIKANPQPALMIVARHLAVEGGLDKKINASNRHIAIPKDFVFRYMVVDHKAKQLGMNPVTEWFHDKYWQKSAHKGNTTYDGEWFYDLEYGLVTWVGANERAIKEAVEPDNPKSLPKALADNLGNWAVVHFLDMIGLPSVVRYIGAGAVAIDEATDAFWNGIGLTEEKRDDLLPNFSDVAITAATGLSEDQWEEKLNAGPDPMFFPDQRVRDEINQEIGNIPPESGWVNSNEDHVRFQQFVAGINGPLYNSVITGKLAILSPDARKQLDQYAYSTHSKNALLGQVQAIDYSRQWKNLLSTGIAADLNSPSRFGPFDYVFKPYAPIDKSGSTVWCEKFTNKPTEVAWANNFPGRIDAQVVSANGADTAGLRLCVRKADDKTGPWTVVSSKDAFSLIVMQPNVQPRTTYLVKPVHGRMNFGAPATVTFNPPVDLIQKLQFTPTGNAPASILISSDGKSDSSLVELGQPTITAKNNATIKGSLSSVIIEGNESAVGPLVTPTVAELDPFKGASWRAFGNRKIFSAKDTGVQIPILDGSGRPTGRTVTVGASGSSNNVDSGNFHFLGKVTPEVTVCGVEGNNIGLPSGCKVTVEGCNIQSRNVFIPLTGFTGKLMIASGDDCITPVKPVEIDFVIDQSGQAFFGAKSLLEASSKTGFYPNSVTVSVGSHPGFLRLKATLNTTPDGAPTCMMAWEYTRVRGTIGNWVSSAANDPVLNEVKQVLGDMPKYMAAPKDGEKALRDAIGRMPESPNKASLLKAMDDAVKEFPSYEAQASVSWKSASFDELVLVQPGTTGADSDAISPKIALGGLTEMNNTTGGSIRVIEQSNPIQLKRPKF